MLSDPVCRLCGSAAKQTQLESNSGRDYILCGNCKLIRMAPQHFLPREKEIERYLEHNNGMQFEGYKEFLTRAIEPALKHINKKMTGLDYGCGHSPTLSKLLINMGYNCEDYDPMFVENPLDKKYDFIFSTEVFEHFFEPHREIQKICDLLEAGGILTVMTVLWNDIKRFKNWYYTRDPSHTAFYHSETFDHICEAFGLEWIYNDGSRIVILKKTDIALPFNLNPNLTES